MIDDLREISGGETVQIILPELVKLLIEHYWNNIRQFNNKMSTNLCTFYAYVSLLIDSDTILNSILVIGSCF